MARDQSLKLITGPACKKVWAALDMREVSCVPGDWIGLAEDRDQWRSYERAVMNFWVTKSQYVS